MSSSANDEARFHCVISIEMIMKCTIFMNVINANYINKSVAMFRFLLFFFFRNLNRKISMFDIFHLDKEMKSQNNPEIIKFSYNLFRKRATKLMKVGKFFSTVFFPLTTVSSVFKKNVFFMYTQRQNDADVNVISAVGSFAGTFNSADKRRRL